MTEGQFTALNVRVLLTLAVKLGLYSDLDAALADASAPRPSEAAPAQDSIGAAVRHALDALDDAREHLIFIGSRRIVVTPPGPA